MYIFSVPCIHYINVCVRLYKYVYSLVLVLRGLSIVWPINNVYSLEYTLIFPWSVYSLAFYTRSIFLDNMFFVSLRFDGQIYY